MRGTRAKALMTEARNRGRDGSVIIGREYKRLKKTYAHPLYAKNVVLHPTKPGAEIAAKRKKEVREKNK